MEIREVKPQMPNLFERSVKKEKPLSVGATPEDATFAASISEMELKENEYRKKKLKELIDEIDREGQNVLAHPSRETVEKYKIIVKAFLEKAVSKSYEMRGSRSSEKAKKKSLYSIVVQIDEKMAELTETVIRDQRPILRLAGKMEEIRGLLMDLLV